MNIDLTEDEVNDIVTYLGITKGFINKQKEQLSDNENINLLDAQLKYLDSLIQKLTSQKENPVRVHFKGDEDESGNPIISKWCISNMAKVMETMRSAYHWGEIEDDER